MDIDQQLPDFFKKREKVFQTDAEILAARAAEALAGLADTYRSQLDQDIQIMRDLLDRAADLTPVNRMPPIRTDFFGKMHDLKGQGTTFGYPLLTDLGGYTCDYLRHKTEITDFDLTVLTRVLNDVECIFRDSLTGEGGSVGADIRRRLSQREYEQ